MNEDLRMFNDQLDRTVKLSGARWAVWLGIKDRKWVVLLQSGLGKARRKEFDELLGSSAIKTWMAGAQSSGRVRSRKMRGLVIPLGCDRIYIFPNADTQSAILVGSDHLPKDIQEFYKILAINDPLKEQNKLNTGLEGSLIPMMDTGLGSTYEPDKVFNWILEILSKSLPIQAAYLAVRVGDIYRINAFWNYDPAILEERIPIYSSRELRLMQATLRGIVSTYPFPEFARVALLSFKPTSSLNMPIFIGQRIIGIVVLVSEGAQGITDADREKAGWILERVAHAVESAIVFDDISRYLQQSILLSELAAAATVEFEPAKIARRLVNRLSRTFRTDRVTVLLASSDGKRLIEFGNNLHSSPLVFSISDSVLGYVVEKEVPYRTGDVTNSPRFSGEDTGTRSLLAAPLKYRGKIIGLIDIESPKQDAFTVQDEQLLVVIASQLAGILENARLMQDANKRAQNLDLIHRVLKEVVGMVDVKKITAVATAMVAEFFRYELVSMLLPDPSTKQLLLMGAGGPQAASLNNDQPFSIQHGITGKVYRTGKSYYSNDVSLDPDYYFSGSWSASAELAVPLRTSDQILGIIDCQRTEKNSFSDDDLLVMESLAGILTSVLINAYRYEESRQTITQLELVRETSLEISNLELDKLFGRVIRNARLLVNAPGVELGLLDQEDSCIRILATENPWYQVEDTTRPLDIGVTGRIAQTGKPFAIGDYNGWEDRLYPDRFHPLSAVGGVPLMIKGEVIGTLVVMDDTPGRVFSEYDLHLLELLAPQVAVSIRNARLYRELQERIEAQNRAERQLLQSARMAAVGEMAAGVAHELNNPLTTVTGFVELALDELPQDLPQRADLQLVLAEAHRAHKVVRRLLDFSRQTEHQRVLVDPGSVLNDLAPLIQHQTHGTDIQVQLLNSQTDLCPILVDQDQIKQVLLNLVQNAIQSMPDGGELSLYTELMDYEEQVGAVFIIQDTGEGILPEHMDRLFEPFFTTRPVGSGTGLGLSVSYGIVTDHNGQIFVESQVGEGSIFRVWFPAYDPDQLVYE